MAHLAERVRDDIALFREQRAVGDMRSLIGIRPSLLAVRRWL
jgi:hypothetical protein